MILKKVFLLGFSILVFNACDNNKFEKNYYNNGTLKEINYYHNSSRADSSIYYNSDGVLERKRYWNDSTNSVIFYDENGIVFKKGMVKNKVYNFRIGKWVFHDLKRGTDSVVEYKTVYGKPYSNQVWIIGSKKDTLENRGNYFENYLKDTIIIGDNYRVNFFLNEPFFSYDSDIEIILPYNDSLLSNDYSNLFKIKRDTFPSLKNDDLPHPEISIDIPLNHHVQFELKYNSSGKKRIRGILIEYINNFENPKFPDSIYRQERRLFFDKTFFIKDTIGNEID